MVAELAVAWFTVANRKQVPNHHGRTDSCFALEMTQRDEMKSIFSPPVGTGHWGKSGEDGQPPAGSQRLPRESAIACARLS